MRGQLPVRLTAGGRNRVAVGTGLVGRAQGSSLPTNPRLWAGIPLGFAEGDWLLPISSQGHGFDFGGDLGELAGDQAGGGG